MPLANIKTSPAAGSIKAAEPDPGLKNLLDRVVSIQIASMSELKEALSGPLLLRMGEALQMIREATGRVIVTGMGKSGHIARKIAATLASTGTPAQYVHPAEASHGDLGMVTPSDVVLALSWSGETPELSDVIHHTKRFRVPLLAMTANPDSSLARYADIALILPHVAEACPHGLAPTSSTLIQLALGDALAVALLESRGFRANDFRELHPGGKLGAKLRLVSDIMHPAPDIPIVTAGLSMAEAILVMTSHRFGTVGVVDGMGRLIGIITDGDIRRHMAPDLMTKMVAEVMSREPKSIEPDQLASEALDLMSQKKITVLFVTRDEQPLGILHIHDLLRAGVV